MALRVLLQFEDYVEDRYVRVRINSDNRVEFQNIHYWMKQFFVFFNNREKCVTDLKRERL